MMPATEFIVIAFTATNSLRVVAYIPQIARLARDRSGAAAVSFCTWMLFLVSHLTTSAYAGVVLSDAWMCQVFAANAMCCAAIVALTFTRRRAQTADVRSRASGTVAFEPAGAGDLGLQSYQSTANSRLPDDCLCGVGYAPRRS